MEQQRALAVLGLKTARTRKEVETAYRCRLHAAAETARADSDNLELRRHCRRLALELNEARQTLLTAGEPKRAAAGSGSHSQEPAPQRRSSSADVAQRTSEPGDSRSAAPRPADLGELEPGRVLANRYEIRARIGRGSLSVVYSAFDRVRHEMLALKVLAPRLAGNAAARERFLTEAKLASTLAHPNIVRVFDLQQSEGCVFLTMELLEGRSLRAEIAQRGRTNPFRVPEVVGWGAQLCDALEHAHAQTVHGGVKPENIWIGPDGIVKLTDFGLAVLGRTNAGPSPEAAPTRATYAAPEQLAGQDVDARADQYSLAAVLYELLTGKVPQSAAQPAHQLRPGLGGTSRVIMRALSLRPEERYADMSAFRQALVRKRIGCVPVRGLLTMVAVMLALAVTYPLWPKLSRERAVQARTAAETARTAWLALLDEQKGGWEYGVPPATFRAEQAWTTAEQHQKLGQYAAAEQDFLRCKQDYEAAATAGKKLLETLHKKNLQEYITKVRPSSSADELPPALQLAEFSQAELLFESARSLAPAGKLAEAEEAYAAAIEHLQQAAQRAGTISSDHVKAWSGLRAQLEALAKSSQPWNTLQDQWMKEQPATWDQFFAQPSDRWERLKKRVKAAMPHDWPSLISEARELTEQLDESASKAKGFLRGVVAAPLKSKAAEAREAVADLVSEIKESPELDEHRKSEAQLRRIIAELLAETRCESKLLDIDEKLRIADWKLAEDPLAALPLYREAERAATRLHADAMSSWKRRLAASGIRLGAAPTQKVPALKDKSLEVARRMLAESGWRWNDSAGDISPQSLYVADSLPAPGAEADPTEVEVQLTLMVKVPDVDDLRLDDAISQLAALGLRPRPDDGSPHAVVMEHKISDSPKSGFSVLGGEIALTPGLRVPNIVGWKVEEGLYALQDAGIEPVLVQKVESVDPPDYRWVGQVVIGKVDPKPGVVIREGQTVEVTRFRYGKGDSSGNASGGTSGQPQQTIATIEESHPPIPPVDVLFANSHTEDLIVILRDKRRPSDRPQEIMIKRGQSEVVRIERDSGGVRAQVVLGPAGEILRVLGRREIEPKTFYVLEVYEHSIQSTYFDSTGTDATVPAHLRPPSVEYGRRSLGVFPLAAGDRLTDGSSVDIYQEARFRNNPGAVRTRWQP